MPANWATVKTADGRYCTGCFCHNLNPLADTCVWDDGTFTLSTVTVSRAKVQFMHIHCYDDSRGVKEHNGMSICILY